MSEQRRGGDVAEADVVGTDVAEADVVGTDVTGADVTGTDVTGADVTGADLAGTDGSSGGGAAHASRRGFLATAGTALGAGLTALGGCVSPLGAAGGSGVPPVSILAAGSLQRTLETGLREAATPPLRVETHGSVTAARLVAGGQRDPDLVALADPRLFGTILDVPWYAEVATNALVVARAATPGGRRVRDADRWFEPVLSGEANLGRTDPALDPLGYRTLFALALGADHYDRPGLRDDVLARTSVHPETSLLSRFETGALDAAVVYRSMAVERDYPAVDLPAAIDLGSPERDDDYAAASYRLPDGTLVRGEHVGYGLWARRTDERVRSVFETLAEGTVLADHGFGTPASLPRYRGPVPAGFGG